MLRRAFLLAAALALAPAAAAEPRISAEDLSEIRAVIHRQIEAFRRDDARGAFALASPGVQKAFGTPERFLDAVRNSYRAVYRPASVSFLELMLIDGGVVQPVELVDRAGARWVAYYGMQRQADGNWRTSGCHLAQPARTISA